MVKVITNLNRLKLWKKISLQIRDGDKLASQIKLVFPNIVNFSFTSGLKSYVWDTVRTEIHVVEHNKH